MPQSVTEVISIDTEQITLSDIELWTIELAPCQCQLCGPMCRFPCPYKATREDMQCDTCRTVREQAEKGARHCHVEMSIVAIDVPQLHVSYPGRT